MSKSEFRVTNQPRYDRRSPGRWIVSHALRYPYIPVAVLACSLTSSLLSSRAQLIIGQVFDHIIGPERNSATLLALTATFLGVRLAVALLGVMTNSINEVLAQRLERDARDELYVALLGKSVTFHSRQRVGDLMARATNDVRQLNFMFSPGLRLILSSSLSLVIPIATIATIDPRLLAAPFIFTVALVITIRDYSHQLNPVVEAQRHQFGVMNAGLAEAISGIEVVKANAQEGAQLLRFLADARRYRDLSVRQGEIQARYLPLLCFFVMLPLALLHAVYLQSVGAISVGQVVAFMGLLGILQFPTFISIFTFSLVQLGLAAAGRILELIAASTELDENVAGVNQPLRGEVVFENVSFAHDGDDERGVLTDVSFVAHPGETIAIVGQTGSGKTTLTRLINRIYDATQGRVLVDGIDVRDWSLASLRSQVSTIEQDVFLFSRSLAENIAFGSERPLTRAEVEDYAREAQAHDFIMSFADGYDTVVGERGVTLSGGQRQRIAIARAFATNPRILILDDSTSAIDSATEDEIQAAMSRVRAGRTTFLITHRLSQIRWADRILVLRRGRLIDQGTHDELLLRSEAYRNIFARLGD